MYFGAQQGYELEGRYCPKCDVAAGFLSGSSTGSPDVPVLWHREGSQLELRPEDRGRWCELPEGARETWERCIRHFVATFLEVRAADWVHCVVDGEDAEIAYSETDESGVKWRFSWCPKCGTGVLSAFDADYGWELCFSVVGGAKSAPYLVLKEYPPASEYPSARDVLGRVPPIETG